MMQKTQAVRALQQGCVRLGLPSSTAVALLQLLSAKRTHDQFVPETEHQLRMSPGATLEKLWHYMLLNPTVSVQVHELLGGVVEHRGTDAHDLSDDTKLLQRLYALNILRLEGQEPDTALWTEAGTAMHTLYLTTSPVPSLQSLPGGGRLYVTPTLSQQQQGQLVQALQGLYAQDTEPCTVDGLPGSAAAAAAAAGQGLEPAAAAAAAGGSGNGPAAAAAAAAAADHGSKPAAKRCRAGVEQPPPQQQQQQQRKQQRKQQQQQELHSDAKKMKITLRYNLSVQYNVLPSIPLGGVMQAFADCVSKEPADLRFLFGGRVSSHYTPQDLGMRDGDVIEVVDVQVGC